jgi:hypothetical protein
MVETSIDQLTEIVNTAIVALSVIFILTMFVVWSSISRLADNAGILNII